MELGDLLVELFEYFDVRLEELASLRDPLVLLLKVYLNGETVLLVFELDGLNHLLLLLMLLICLRCGLNLPLLLLLLHLNGERGLGSLSTVSELRKATDHAWLGPVLGVAKS